MAMTVFGFIIPIIIISTSYTIIVKVVEKHNNNLNKCLRGIHMLPTLYECNEMSSNSIKLNKHQVEPLMPPLKIEHDSILKMKKQEASVIREKKRHFSQNKLLLIAEQMEINKLIKNRLILKKDIKLTKFTFLIIISFCVSWFPYTLLAIIGQFVQHRETIVTPYTAYMATVFAKCSTVFNPMLYLLLKKKCIFKFWYVCLGLAYKN